MENNQTNQIIKTREIIQKMIVNSKFIEIENNTGYSYFSGKTRLVKLLKTKKLITLEINQKIPNNLENLEGITKISYIQAHSKHLGTMKYLYKSNNSDNIEKIIKACLNQYNKDNKDNSNNSDNSKQVK